MLYEYMADDYRFLRPIVSSDIVEGICLSRLDRPTTCTYLVVLNYCNRVFLTSLGTLIRDEDREWLRYTRRVSPLSRNTKAFQHIHLGPTTTGDVRREE